VPAIEPDIRGAKTIREQLAKHRSQQSCAVCHVKIDPPGFALENFDPAGQWRDRYLQSVGGKRSRGLKVDASYAMPDGQAANGAFPYNPNGSLADIAGICDTSGRVFGLMPHPERLADPQLGGSDGRALFDGLVEALS